MYPKADKYSGLTLIELLIAAMLFSVIVFSSALLLSVGLKEWNYELDRVTIREEGMPAMETMVRYLGVAGAYPLLTGGITSASSTSVTFLADVDNTGTNQTVTISYASGKVTCTIVGATTRTVTLAPYVSSFSLTYYNSSGTLIPVPITLQTNRDTIQVITISMTMNKGTDTINLSSSAFCRNNHT